MVEIMNKVIRMEKKMKKNGWIQNELKKNKTFCQQIKQNLKKKTVKGLFAVDVMDRWMERYPKDDLNKQLVLFHNNRK